MPSKRVPIKEEISNISTYTFYLCYLSVYLIIKEKFNKGKIKIDSTIHRMIFSNVPQGLFYKSELSSVS